ncbi:MAG: hypothetical protein KAH38_05140, partial [Candidatus Hydrogenedentes bacterium]|nr:hypothetical protein [Candidatus Hydrogenedentota bacterium]
MTRFFYTSIFCLAAAALLPLSSTFSEEATPMRLSEKYPDLSHGILSQAQLQDLPANTLVRIDEKDITRE